MTRFSVSNALRLLWIGDDHRPLSLERAPQLTTETSAIPRQPAWDGVRDRVAGVDAARMTDSDRELPGCASRDSLRSTVWPMVSLLLALSTSCVDAPARLSETTLYEDIATKSVSPRARPFTPRFVLWSDGAEKSRWILLPDGEVIDTADMDHWVFPVGTQLFKEFRRDGRRVETRVLEKRAGSWVSSTYRWEADESDAVLANYFGEADVHGTAHDIPWNPACNFCHGDAEPPLAFTAMQLARGPGDAPAPEGHVTLDALVAEGRLTHAPSALVVPGDAVAQRALGVLHANCGSCHAETGSQNDLPLRLRLESTGLVSLEATGVMQTAVGHDAEDAIGGLRRYISAGEPDASLLVLRMTSTDPELRMPPTARELTDELGVEALRAFVTSLGARP
jgi:cytochrome c553